MPGGIFGRKLGMTRIFEEGGAMVPVTVIEAGPCFVVQRKTSAQDGYEALQVGYDRRPLAKSNNPYLADWDPYLKQRWRSGYTSAISMQAAALSSPQAAIRVFSNSAGSLSWRASGSIKCNQCRLTERSV